MTRRRPSPARPGTFPSWIPVDSVNALRLRWTALSVRERRLVALAGVALFSALLWSFALKPAMDTIRAHHALLPQLRAQAAEIDGLILQAQALDRYRAGRVHRSEIPAALQDSLMRNGLGSSLIRVEHRSGTDAVPEEWEVVIGNTSADALIKWLASMPSMLQVQIKRVALQRGQENGRDRPGQVNGRVVIQAAPTRSGQAHAQGHGS